MENKPDFLARAEVAVSQWSDCGATGRETGPVKEVFRGQTVWEGEVEVFDLSGHPKARRAYAWSRREGQNDEGERFVVVREIPPVVSPLTAVRASIVFDAKRRKANHEGQPAWPGRSISRQTAGLKASNLLLSVIRVSETDASVLE